MRWAGPVSVAVHVALLAVLASHADTPPPLSPPMLEVALLSPPAPEPEPALPTPPPPEPPRTEQAPEPPPPELPPVQKVEEPPPVVIAMVKPRPRPHRPPPPEPVSAPAPEAPREPFPAQPVEATAAPQQQTAAAQAPPAPPRAPAGPPPSWLGEVMARLERQKDYPHEARRSRREGVAMLRFSVDREGRVLGWKLERSTGHPQLDGAVERMIERATLPPMPPEMDGQMADLVVPVRFALR